MYRVNTNHLSGSEDNTRHTETDLTPLGGQVQCVLSLWYHKFSVCCLCGTADTKAIIHFFVVNVSSSISYFVLYKFSLLLAQQCNVNITIILDVDPEDNRGIRSGDRWSAHGSFLSSPMIMQMHVEREYPVSVLSVQALTVFLVSEDTIPLCLFTKKTESYVVSDVTAQHTVTSLP